jgi:hypothetical protein
LRVGGPARSRDRLPDRVGGASRRVIVACPSSHRRGASWEAPTSRTSRCSARSDCTARTRRGWYGYLGPQSSIASARSFVNYDAEAADLRLGADAMGNRVQCNRLIAGPTSRSSWAT